MAQLHFISVEKFPLLKGDLQKALELWPELAPLSDQLLSQYPPVNARGFHRLKLNDNVNLTLIFDDAEKGLEQLLPIKTVGPELRSKKYGWSDSSNFTGLIDAWFLDGFAPSKNPDMWTPALFSIMSRLSFKPSDTSLKKHTTFATFTSAGIVKRGLAESGFTIEKVPGFARKREMLKGFFSPSLNCEEVEATKPDQRQGRKIKADPSWHIALKSQSQAEHVAIIGAGLAGCQTAKTLASKGIKVTLIDRHQVSSGASGNPSGILYSKLSHSQGIFTDFNLAAYLFACRHYQHNNYYTTTGQNSGVIQLAENPKQVSQYQSIAETYQFSPDFVRWLSPKEASKKSGVSVNLGGLWFPQAGWLNPPKLCQSLIQHPNISVIESTQIQQIALKATPESPNAQKWQLLNQKGECVVSSDAIVIACAYSAKKFEQCQRLPTKAIRGQISLANESSSSQALTTVLCGTGYITPAINKVHCIGASFNLKSHSTDLQQQDHTHNIENANKLSSSFSNIQLPSLSEGRVSFRCTTPDYLPIVGPVADEAIMLERFSEFRTNFKKTIDKPGAFWPGLYINIGHGSKGLSYTPLCAEILGCLITGEPLPISRDLMTHIHSARFLMRDLARNRL